MSESQPDIGIGSGMLRSVGRLRLDSILSRKSFRAGLLVSVDLVAFIISVACIEWLSPTPEHASSIASQLIPLIFALIMGMRLYGSGRYAIQVNPSAQSNYLQQYCAIAFLAHLGCVYLSHFQDWPLLLVWFLFPAVAGGLRRMIGQSFDISRLLVARTVLVGSPAALGIARNILNNEVLAGLEVVGEIAASVAPSDNAGAWRALLTRYDAEIVVTALQGHHDERAILQSLQQAGVPATKLIALQSAGQPAEAWRPARAGAVRVGRGAKALMDFSASLAMLVTCSPAILLLAGLVKLDGGPALFRHERVGRHGRMFHCLKFRTMFPNGDQLLHDLLEKDPAAQREWNETRKLRSDPRVTPIGRLLRATSLDELPQLLNVLQGEMSLVGPRPIVPAELPRYGSDVAYYLAVTPGVTGLWQVSGRSETSYERRVQLDVTYVQGWSFWKDLRILFQTITVVLLRQGAV